MLTELRDGVWWYEATGVNAYLVADGDGVTVVDAATPFDAATVEAAIEQAGFDLGDVTRILITHYDIDHVGSVAKLAVDAPIYIGRADAPLLTGEDRVLPLNVKRFTQFITGPLIPDVAAERVNPVADGDKIGGFTAYHTPGHTPGHTVFVHEDRSAALLGDLVVEYNGSLRPAPWFISDDTGRLHESLQSFAVDTPDFEVAAMGHGVPFSAGGAERIRELVDTKQV